MNTRLNLLLLAMASTVSGCASSPTEEAFGDALRATLAAQRAQPEPVTSDEPAGMDGQRAEGVISVYRGVIGNPATVVGSQPAERE
jgi:type IV pilus biogenesis protein CpaD/CtpE